MGNHTKILDDHARLDVLLRDLRMVAKWEATLLRNYDVRARLSKDLDSLKIRLEEHFKTEESGSYMQEICSRKADAGDILRTLQTEHPVFLNLVTMMKDTCDQKDEDLEAYNKVLRTLTSLLDLLKVHEEKENALIKEVFQY